MKDSWLPVIIIFAAAVILIGLHYWIQNVYFN